VRFVRSALQLATREKVLSFERAFGAFAQVLIYCLAQYLQCAWVADVEKCSAVSQLFSAIANVLMANLLLSAALAVRLD
jgi:hypothetical protein